jgi:hypothetical protein
MIEIDLASVCSEESSDLKNIRVRPVTEAEKGRWAKLLSEYHYLGWLCGV